MKSWKRLLPGLILFLALALVVSLIVIARGFSVKMIELHDSGIWVTNNEDGLFGRVNKTAGSIDAFSYPPGGAQQAYDLDVFQDGQTVLARDLA